MTYFSRFFVVATALLLGMSPGLADDPMASIYGNTLSVVYPDGAEVRLHVNENQTYHGILPDGSQITGVWEMSGTELCFTRQQPAPQAPACDPFEGKQVGDTWQGTGLNDAPVTLTLVEGR